MTSTIQIDDIVWAKMPSYPLWPAIVITPVRKITAPYIGDESQHFVKFYGPGTNNCSWIPDKHIVKHSPNLIKEARKNKSKKLQTAINQLEKHLKREGLFVEIQDEEECKKKSYKKRKRGQEVIKTKNKKTKISGHKEINDTDVVIEDHNLYKNQKEIDNYHQMQEKESLFDSLLTQNKNEEKRERDQEEIKTKNKKTKVSGHNEINDTDVVIEDHNLDKNLSQKEIVDDHQMQEKESLFDRLLTRNENEEKRERDQEEIKTKNKKTKVSGHNEINDTDVVIDHNLDKNLSQKEVVDCYQMQEKESAFDSLVLQNEDKRDKAHKVDELPKVLPIKDCVTEKGSTSPEQCIDPTLKFLFSDEILLNEFWRNKNGKKEALQHFLKVIEVLKVEIAKEESLNIQEFDMQLQYQEEEVNKDMEDKDNNGENEVVCIPEMRETIDQQVTIEKQVLSTKDSITENKSSSSEQSTAKTVISINFSKTLAGEFFGNNISDKKEETMASPKALSTTSNENEFHENVRIGIAIRPNDIDKLQLKSPLKCLNIFPDVLPSLIKPVGVPNDSTEKKVSFKKYLPRPSSPIKFGFMGNGFLKSSILRNLILKKFNVTIWIDTSIEDSDNVYYATGARTVKTFNELIKNCDIIFSYWKSIKTVKFQMLQVLCSVSKEVFAKKGYVELSTLDLETAKICGRAITNHGGRFLEAAVLGDIQDASNSDLVLLASGDQNLFNECSFFFRAISRFSHYCTGKIGQGSVMKVGLSMLQGTALASLAEVVALIQRNGFKEEEFTDFLNLTPFQDRFWIENAKSMFKDNRISFWQVEDQRKDFYLGLQLLSSQPKWTCLGGSYFFKEISKDASATASVNETPENKKNK